MTCIITAGFWDVAMSCDTLLHFSTHAPSISSKQLTYSQGMSWMKLIKLCHMLALIFLLLWLLVFVCSLSHHNDMKWVGWGVFLE